MESGPIRKAGPAPPHEITPENNQTRTATTRKDGAGESPPHHQNYTRNKRE